MATYSVNVTESYSYFPDNLSGSQATVFAVTNSLAGASYYTLETVPPFGWYYSGSTPSISGSFSYTSGINNLVSDNYKMSVVVAPGGGSFTFTPAVPITGSQLLLRGTGYKDVNNQADAVVASFAAAVNGAGGLLTGSEYNALLGLTSDLISYNLLGKMKAIYPVVSSQRNFLPNTDTFSSWRYAEFGGTITGGQLDPLGEYTAYLLTGATIFLPSPNSISPVNTPLVQSIWVKSATGGNVGFSIGSGADNGTRVDKVATPTWTRITNTFTSGQSGGMNLEFIAGPIYVWHPQVELGTTPTDYQPTVGLAADVFKNSFKFNLVNPARFSGSFTSGWAFSPTGMTPNGTSAYMDTSFTPFTQLSVLSAHSSFYLRTPMIPSNAGYGVVKSDYSERMDIINFGGTLYSAIGSQGQNAITTTPYQSLILGSRTSSTSNKLYLGGVLRDTKTLTNTANLPNLNYWLGAVNQSGGFWTSEQCAFATIGDGLSDTDAFLFYLAVQRYQTALNRQV
jgi:hypothetical protein